MTTPQRNTSAEIRAEFESKEAAALAECRAIREERMKAYRNSIRQAEWLIIAYSGLMVAFGIALMLRSN